MTTSSHEERISRLEGAFEMFATVVGNMVTREEHQASIEMLRAEIRGVEEKLLAEIRGTEGTLRAEMRAEMRAMELRITLRLGGAIFTAVGLGVALLKLWPS